MPDSRAPFEVLSWTNRTSGTNGYGRWRSAWPCCQASPRVSESLDFDTVLLGVLDPARSLTGARYRGTLGEDAHHPCHIFPCLASDDGCPRGKHRKTDSERIRL